MHKCTHISTFGMKSESLLLISHFLLFLSTFVINSFVFPSTNDSDDSPFSKDVEFPSSDVKFSSLY